MTEQKPTFPLPPGITEEEVNLPTSALVNFDGLVLTLYVATRELGGVYRIAEEIWQLWYPISPPEFQQAASLWLREAGLPEKAEPSIAASTPPGVSIN